MTVTLLLIAAIALAYLIVRRRGASIVATYRAAGGGLAGVKAVIVGYKTLVAGAAAGVISAIPVPEILTALSGVDFTAILPSPWGEHVALAFAILVPIIAASRATPAGTPPSGEA